MSDILAFDRQRQAMAEQDLKYELRRKYETPAEQLELVKVEAIRPFMLNRKRVEPGTVVKVERREAVRMVEANRARMVVGDRRRATR